MTSTTTATGNARTGLVILPPIALANVPLSITSLSLPCIDNVASNSSTQYKPSNFHVLHASSNTQAVMAIVELHHYTSKHGSYFLVPSLSSLAVQSLRNGNVTFATLIDPLFVALHYMHASKKDSVVYQSRSDMLQDDARIMSLVSGDQLGLVCDTKQAMDETFYKLSMKKVWAWIRFKMYKMKTEAKIIMSQKDTLSLITSYLPCDFLQGHEDDGGLGVNDVDELESNDVKQIESDAANLAMDVIRSDAQLNHQVENDYSSQQLSASTTKKTNTPKKSTSNKFKNVTPSASAKKFWASHSAKNNAGNKSNNKKSTTSASSSANNTLKKSSSKNGTKRKRT